MARVLISTFGSSGDLNPYLAVSTALKSRGHEPVIATMPAYGPKILNRGVGFYAVRPSLGLDPAIVRQIMDPSKGTEFLIRQVLIGQLNGAYQDLSAAADAFQPDLIITHPASFSGPLVAETRKLPWLSSVLSPMSLFSADDPPAYDRVPWLLPVQRRFKIMTRILIALGRRMSNGWVAPYHALRIELGLPPTSNPLFEGLWSNQGVLALFSSILGPPQRDWPANVTVTGFPIDDGGRLDGTRLGTSPELARFLDMGAPPLVFALGSAAVFRPGDFFEVAAAAAQSLGRRAVLVLGETPQVEIAGHENLFVCRDATSFAELFPRAAAIIHQGGIGTLARAMASGKPSLIVPFAFDQPDNAARLSRLGSALSIPRQRWTKARAIKGLETLLSDTKIAETAARIGAAVSAENASEAAADAIERFLGDRIRGQKTAGSSHA